MVSLLPIVKGLLRPIAVLALAVTLAAPSPARAADCVDLALVLAVDGSGSINPEEFALQRQAIVSAFSSPDVLQAIDRAGLVAAAVLYWGDAEWPVQQTGFIRIGKPEDAKLLVAAVETMPRQVLGSTGLSNGLSAALDKLETVGCAYRSVINVSGDGADTFIPRKRRLAPSLRNIRARATAAEVTINALVITNDEPDLKSYFEKQVITGPGAFVIEINAISDYSSALRRKLIREISPSTLSQR
ncbi:DUF1194 domain-containing protein [Aestuariivirga sp.]|uniref:DUF1194 domain-containing protein n=1 Tax=Aestuariivirga sp. TaxID=2650926 RepID=UPI0037847C63